MNKLQGFVVNFFAAITPSCLQTLMSTQLDEKAAKEAVGAIKTWLQTEE
jgi:hypothetical protein